MTTTGDAETDRLRRHLRALASVNRQLQAMVDSPPPSRRSGLGDRWIAGLSASADPTESRLVRTSSGEVFVLEGGQKRAVKSALIAAALEQVYGPRMLVQPDALDDLVEGPPVEVLEGPKGSPFVVVGNHRHAVRDLPLTHPVKADQLLVFPEGREVTARPRDQARAASEQARHLAPLPTFLIIGAQKSATRWLRSNLGRHPQIYTAPQEIAFFNNDQHFAELGVEWYRSQFAGWSGEPFLGEATPGYMMWRHQPEVVSRRIDDTIPGVRLIAILRNPVDRAYSAMIHHQKRDQIPPHAELTQLVKETDPNVDLLGIVAGGWYAASLRPFLRRFGSRLLVLIHDELSTNPKGLYRRALTHIGADPSFVPPNLEETRFSNRTEEERQTDPLTTDQRRDLFARFSHDIHELEELLGRPLTEWYPPVD